MPPDKCRAGIIFFFCRWSYNNSDALRALVIFLLRTKEAGLPRQQNREVGGGANDQFLGYLVVLMIINRFTVKLYKNEKIFITLGST
jgi:hypothetical protein